MATKSNKAVKISQKHLLGIQDLSIADVNFILNEAKQFIKLNKSKNKKLDTLRGKTQINLFFEPKSKPINLDFLVILFLNSSIVIILYLSNLSGSLPNT